jgi:hypothetical protein
VEQERTQEGKGKRRRKKRGWGPLQAALIAYEGANKRF